MTNGISKRAVLIFSALFLVAMLAVTGPAGAIPIPGTITVTTLNDEQNMNGFCSLREAIINANNNDQSGSTDCAAGTGADTINFSVTGTILLGNVLPTIYQNLTIDGPGAASLTISGNSAYRVMTIDGPTVTVKNVTIANSYSLLGIGGGIQINSATVTVNNCIFSNNTAYRGAGISNYAGLLTITNSTFSGNTASNYGGAIYSEWGTTNVSNSTFSGNSADYYGGAIYNYYSTLGVNGSTFSGNSSDQYAGGGIMNYAESTANINNSTFSGNSAGDLGGGIFNYSTATANITNSTFSGNSAVIHGGGIYNANNSILDVTNSTFSGNSAGSFGGGIFSYSSSTVTLTNDTFSGNSAGAGGGLFNSNGTLTIQNSIVADSPSGGNCVNDVNASYWYSNGYNIDTDNTCLLTNLSDQPGIPPMLNALASNGGPTDTMALAAGSPAIDMVPQGVNGCGTTVVADQRGIVRPSPSGGLCDIGAYEVNQQIIDLTGSWSTLYSTLRGKNLSGILRIQNTGKINAGSFNVAVYLSNNGTTLGNLLKNYTVTGLSAGMSKNISFSYSSAVSLTGKYIIAVIDSGNQISETDESNNRARVRIP